MRRTERLFQIIQVLRSRRRMVTGRELAEELEISLRTLYRDMAELVAQRVPIRGEAGIGYVLERGLDMPPLMLTTDEIEAAVLGAQWVMNRGDPQLAKAARDLMAKIEASVPDRLRLYIEEPAARAPQMARVEPDAIDLSAVRAAIHAGRKIALDYRDKDNRASQRIVWPILLGYFETTRLICAWCETRQDFRSFRADRIVGATFMSERYPERPTVLRAKWRKKMEAERAKWMKAADAAS